jgi:hypothetical protein
MNHLDEEYARHLARRRAETTSGPRVPTRPRRTTRRRLASGLHRLADRLDDGL